MKKEMLINVLQPEECRIAIVEDGILEELYVERTSHELYTGNIYKGRIVNIEAAIQAAFVDFSVGRNGFLHVSDVEPHYYRRGQAGAADAEPTPPRTRDNGGRGQRDRDRDEPRRSRAETPPTPPPATDRDPFDWDRYDRPDRSEKGRRDRSSDARRFGEGLFEDERTPPRPSESERQRPETRRSRPEPTPTPAPPRVELPPTPIEDDEIPSWGRERERSREPERPSSTAAAEAFHELERYLPPSRTQRPSPGRPTEPESNPAELETGRGRPRPRPTPTPTPPPTPASRSWDADEPLHSVRPDEPTVESGEPEDRSEPRRRGGRAAIRARSGDQDRDRPAPPPTVRERDWDRPRDWEQPREPADRPSWSQDESVGEGEPAQPTPPTIEPERPQAPRIRERDRGRDRDRETPRNRPTESETRAGQPGYVPRREREKARPTDTPEIDPVVFDWLEPDRTSSTASTPSPAIEPSGADDDESGDGRRRRRRRRRRRSDEPITASEPEMLAGDDDLLEAETGDLEPASPTDEFETPEPVQPRADRERGRGRKRGRDRDRDRERPREEFVDDDLEGMEAIDDDDSSALHDALPEEEIDPELEDEIRREIEEIQVLERELGLGGTVEARGRGEDDAPDPLTRGPKAFRGGIKPPIQEVFRRGDEVLVQVIKESIGTKGPTLSTYISIPGRYLVLMPGLNRVGVSRKIADESQRRKLRQIMNELNPPKGLGFIVRTAGLDRTKRELARDLAYLLRLWKVILRRIKKTKGPAPIYQESDMIIRTIRDIFSGEIDTIWIDERQAFERAQDFMRVVMPKHVDRVRFYDEKVPLFHKYGLEDEIAKIQRRRVDLPEGGSIVIDQTEALVAIDVNSGNFRVEDDAERTAYEMNLRAAKEIARQLRLRDLGGVIVNDFIDMREEKHRRGVERAVRDAMKRDRARTKILRMSQFGLIEMTRQRIRPSLKRSIYEDCSHCTGAGVTKTAESMAIDVMRLLALAAHRAEIRRVNLCVASSVATYLNNRKRHEIARLETESNMAIHIRHDDKAAAEHLQIDCYDAQNVEVRLLPQPPPPFHPRRGR